MLFRFKNKFLYPLCLFFGMVFIFGLGVNYAQAATFETCTTFTSPWWQVKTVDGTAILTVDNNGNLDVAAININLGTAPSGNFSDSFIIKDSSGVDRFVFNKNDVYIPGTLNKEASQADLDNINGDDFIVKNDSGVIVARFEVGTGDIYIKGTACGFAIEINSCEELQKIGNDASYPLDGNYVLTQDIDCSATNPANPNNAGSIWDKDDAGSYGFGGTGFDPINTFTGSFNGDGYKISFLYINRPSEFSIGLFGSISKAHIVNIGFENVDITGSGYVGGIAGRSRNNSFISHVFVEGSVQAINSDVGGLVGYNYNNSSISNSYTKGTVEGHSMVGGLVGYNYNNSSISNSYSLAQVEGEYTYVGGLVGRNEKDASIINSYAMGNVSGGVIFGFYSNYIGGLVGRNNNGASIINSYVSNRAISYRTNPSSIGSFAGANDNSSIMDSYYNIEIANGDKGCGGTGDCAGVEGKSTTEMILETTFEPEWIFEPDAGYNWKLDTITPTGRYYPCLTWQEDGTCPIAPLTISSCEELQKIGNDASYPLDGEYILTQDIDCSATNPSDPDNADSVWDNGGLGFDPIGAPGKPFNGSLDGNDYTISDLYINRPSDTFVGLIGYADTNTKLNNIILSEPSITADRYVGALIGNINGDQYSTVLENIQAFCITTGKIESKDASSFAGATGALIGRFYGADMNPSLSPIVSNLSADCPASGKDNIGGLIGELKNTKTSNLSATGDVIGTTAVGGLIGRVTRSIIENSFATGDVNGENQVGGLIGAGTSQTGSAGVYQRIENCFASGNVIETGDYGADFGGLVGSSGLNIRNSYATGNVQTGTNSRNIGGLIGSQSYNSIIKSYATGSVQGGTSVGGLGGLWGSAFPSSYNPSVSASYSTGNVIGNTDVGGFAGTIHSGGIYDSYSVGQVIGTSNIGGLIGSYTGGDTLRNFWNTETSNQTLGCGSGDCTGTEGKTTDEMNSGATPSNESATFADWTFLNDPADADWKLDILGANYYPCLTWQDDGTCPKALITISSCEELQKIGNDASYPLDGEYILTQDIDCSATNPSDPNNPGSVWDNDGLGFDPIGEFSGSFDGNSKIISNLYIYRPNRNQVGMFSSIRAQDENWAVVKDLTLEDNKITGDGSIGSLAGAIYGQTTISNVHAIGDCVVTKELVDNEEHAGGLAGGVGLLGKVVISNSHSECDVNGQRIVAGFVAVLFEDSEILNSYATGNVIGSANTMGGFVGTSYGLINNSFATGDVSGDGNPTGGLVGINTGFITDSYATGGVNGDYASGGLVGINTGFITDSYATGNISNSGFSAGGLVGNNGGSITDSYATGGVNGFDSIGGLVGYNYNYSTISNSYATGNVVGDYRVGGLVGIMNNNTSLADSYWNTETSGQSSSVGGIGRTTAEMVQESTFEPEWIFEPDIGYDWKLDTITPTGRYYPCLAWQDDGTCPKPDPLKFCLLDEVIDNIPSGGIPVSNCAELQAINSNLSANYYLTQNIDCNGVYFDPIGNVGDTIYGQPFTGILDGRGYTISNLAIDKPTENTTALFNIVEGSQIDSQAGSFTAEIRNLILANVKINGAYNTGGLAGKFYFGSIKNVCVSGDVTGTRYLGGLVGTLIDSKVSKAGFIGNIRGIGEDTIFGVGGLIGNSSDSLVDNSFSNGSINLIVSDTAFNVGGLMGSISDSGADLTRKTLKNSFSRMNIDIQGNARAIGGLVGVSWSLPIIDNSYANGGIVINGDGEEIGGHTGHEAYPSVHLGGRKNEISYSYSTGKVEVIGTKSYVGGFIGRRGDEVTNNFWDINTSGQNCGCGGGNCYYCPTVYGKITPEMQIQSTFTDEGWNFSSIWSINEGESYPCHQWWISKGGSCPTP